MQKYYPEIFIGLVAPIGTNLKKVKAELTRQFTTYDYDIVEIKITELAFDLKTLKEKLPKSFQYYLKMELCRELREEYGSGVLAALSIKNILRERKQNKKDHRRLVFLIDQIKNKGEYDLFSQIYDINYIQISCTGTSENRDKKLKKDFEKDIDTLEKNLLDGNKYYKRYDKDEIVRSTDGKSDHQLKLEGTIEQIVKQYQQYILPDTSHQLIQKDFVEIDASLRTEDEKKKKKYGQQVSNIFHESHYFINADAIDIESQVKKFVELLFGVHKEYPTQDEFGMSLAYTAAVRSNFPGDRQIGACIISEHGEVISVSSVRAPSPDSNPQKFHEWAVTNGYNENKDKIEGWIKILEEIKPEENNVPDVNNIKKYLKNSLGRVIN